MIENPFLLTRFLKYALEWGEAFCVHRDEGKKIWGGGGASRFAFSSLFTVLSYSGRGKKKYVLPTRPTSSLFHRLWLTRRGVPLLVTFFSSKRFFPGAINVNVLCKYDEIRLSKIVLWGLQTSLYLNPRKERKSTRYVSRNKFITRLHFRLIRPSIVVLRMS
jgi:hypothetical protein